MAASARIDELRSKFEANPRRYFAPLANEYRKAGDLGTAIALLRTQLRLFPQHMSGHVVLGQALFEAGELDDARQVFERAVELDAENLIALRHLGDIARELGDAARARSWYQRVLEVDPYNEQISALLHQLTLAPTTRAEPATRDDLEGLTEVAVWPPAIEVHPEAEAEAPQAPAPEPAPPPEPALAAEPVQAALEFIDVAEDDFLEWAPPAAEAQAEPETGVVAPEPEPIAPRLDAVDAATFDPVVGLDLVPLHDEAFEQLEHVEESAPVAPAAAEPWIPEEGAPLELVTSDTFATETMAELCLEQGHEEEALAIYERLVVQRPDDADLAERARTLRERLHPAAEVPAPPPSPPSTPRAPTPTVAPHMEERDAWAANAWASALRPDAPPAEPLLPDLSFDRFFDGATFVEEPTAAAAPPAPEPAPEPAPAPTPSPAAPTPASAPASEEEDLAEFNAWLKGLRDS